MRGYLCPMENMLELQRFNNAYLPRVLRENELILTNHGFESREKVRVYHQAEVGGIIFWNFLKSNSMGLSASSFTIMSILKSLTHRLRLLKAIFCFSISSLFHFSFFIIDFTLATISNCFDFRAIHLAFDSCLMVFLIPPLILRLYYTA